MTRKTDYKLEVRQWMPNAGRGYFQFLGLLDQRIQPGYTREMNMADQLTFNLQLSDPNCLLFDGSFGREVWLYGTDGQLKQVFVPVTEEFIRDYGATSMSSGSGALGSGSGDSMHVVCEGPENYLTRFITKNYKTYQRSTTDVLTDVLQSMLNNVGANNIQFEIVVDPSLDIPLDIDLSWENCWTAVTNIIAQTGGYAYVGFDPQDPTLRTLYLIPVPEDNQLPKGAGMNSAVLPQ